MTRKQTLKTVLNTAMREDFTIRAYSENNYAFCFAFYKLNDTNNGLLYVHKDDGAPSIDFQYTRKTQRHELLLRRFSRAFGDMIKHGERKEALDIVAHYTEVTKRIFDAKYSIDEELYIYND